jgi:hypothetical protein
VQDKVPEELKQFYPNRFWTILSHSAILLGSIFHGFLTLSPTGEQSSKSGRETTSMATFLPRQDAEEPKLHLFDQRRPDLKALWEEIIGCVRKPELLKRCFLLTWQQLASAAPDDLRRFLNEKYGIEGEHCDASNG